MPEISLLASRNRVLSTFAAIRNRWLAACAMPVIGLMLAWPGLATAQLDLRRLERHQLDNGLQVLLLEEHTFPSASVQMLYRVGGRNEPVGQSGIAHFLEHMAFRATENFPDTDVVSRIYAAGGEWHGYTWIDQTTYFSTVPSDQLELLLRIEADRMQRLLIEPRWIEPEKGAVLAEMHGYENDPASVLHDAVVFATFQAHPYRNNVIGWEPDILALRHGDVLDFYRRHYGPGNAVLAVVGDIDSATVLERVQQGFGDFPATAPTPLPHTTEPAQKGERRIELLGAGDSNHFEIAWPAPAANHPDFAAMLVLQQWLSGGTGVNFMQNSGTSPVQPGSALHGRFESLSSWYPPAAQDYLFSLQGTVAADADLRQAEQVIEDALRRVREGQLDPEAIEASKRKVLEELVYDLASHEHTAHQLAYYAGLDALDEWLALPQSVARVSVADLQALATRRLQPWQRNIGWYRAGDPPLTQAVPPTGAATTESATGSPAGGVASGPTESARGYTDGVPANSVHPGQGQLPEPQSLRAASGLPVLVQANPATASSHVSLVLDGAGWQGSSYLQTDHPAWGYSSLSAPSLPSNITATLDMLVGELSSLEIVQDTGQETDDPYARLQREMEGTLGLKKQAAAQPAVSLAVLSGQVPSEQLQGVMARLTDVVPTAPAASLGAAKTPLQDRRVDWPRALAQAQLAYVYPAPLPTAPDYLAWRALQYILAHDYEGRLGKEAISNRGLAYYIDSQYRSDGRRAWIGLSTGVDPAKLATLEALFREQVAGLQQHPPTSEEVDEARNHLIGRLATARQTNVELATGLAEQWLWHGRLPGAGEQREAIRQLDQEAILQAVPGLLQGRYVVIGEGKAAVNVTD
jgi:predicted Zn-dependent peptidase